MNDLLVAADIGTSRLKVGVSDREGRLVTFAERPCAPDYRSDGRIHVCPETWWTAFEQAFEDCLGRVDRSAVRAIGISSQAQTYVFMNAGGQPAGPAISWLDAHGDAEGVAHDLDGFDYREHVGWSEPTPILAACKLRAAADEAGAPATGAHLLFADGYLMNRLSGGYAVSRNLAAMSGLFSMIENDWWAEAVAAAKVAPEALPTIRDIGEAAGVLAGELAQQWGIPKIPIVAGANDQTAAALGAGLCNPGDAALALGTALVVYQVVAPEASALGTPDLWGPYVGGLKYQLRCHNTGCAVIDWAGELFALDDNYETLFSEAVGASPGASGLRFSPHLGGAGADRPGGALVGLGLAHARPQILRAVLEGLACTAREQLDMLCVADGAIVTGGGAANDGWLQLIADLTGRTLLRSDEKQATLKGTAMMAAHGAGLADDLLKLAGEQRTTGTRFSPRAELTEIYEKVYRDYLRLRGSPPSACRCP